MGGDEGGGECYVNSVISVTMMPLWAMRAANIHFNVSDLLLAIFASRFASFTSRLDCTFASFTSRSAWTPV